MVEIPTPPVFVTYFTDSSTGISSSTTQFLRNSSTSAQTVLSANSHMMDSLSRHVHYDPPRRTELFILKTMYNKDEELYEPIQYISYSVLQLNSAICKVKSSITHGNPCPARTSIEGLLSRVPIIAFVEHVVLTSCCIPASESWF